MTHSVFEGRIVFECEAQSIGSDLEADALKARIQEAIKPDESLADRLEECVVLVATTTVTFAYRADENAPLLKFKAWWEGRKASDPAVFWQGWLRMPYPILREWRKAFLQGQELWAAGPELLPLAALSPAEKDEALTPNSPLPSNGGRQATR